MSSTTDDLYFEFKELYEELGYTQTHLINCYKQHTGLETKNSTFRKRISRRDEETFWRLTMFMFEKNPGLLEQGDKEDDLEARTEKQRQDDKEDDLGIWDDTITAIIVVVMVLFAIFWIFQSHEKYQKTPTQEKIKDELKSKNFSVRGFADHLYGEQNDSSQPEDFAPMPESFFHKIDKQLRRATTDEELLNEYLEIAKELVPMPLPYDAQSTHTMY